MRKNTIFRKTAALFVAAAIAASAMPVVSYAAMNTSEFASGYSYPTTMRGLTAFQIVNDMGAGWNLGNTLESDNNETYWGNPTTTKAMIDTIAARGFTTLRVPVRWDDHYTNASTYTIDSSYMDRVETVVNYGLANDMYVILNVHHNDLQHNVPNTDAISAELSAVWTQIGERFKNYGDKLIFEVNNEPRSGDDWTGNATYYDSVNECNEAARKAIRATGGNNTERLVMLPTYCASGDAAKSEAWTKNANDDMIAASIHAYLPFDFAFTPSGHSDWLASDLTELQGFFDRMYTYFLSKNIPVVIGEFGAVNKNNTTYREQYTAIYGQLARQFAQQDIPCVWWDNNCFNTNGENFGIFNRRANSFVYDGVDCGGIADGLIEAYIGDPVYEISTTGETVIFEGSASASNYNQPVSFSPDYVTSMGTDDAIYVKYSGDTPYMVLQSWTNGEKWITVDADSNSNGVLIFKRSTLLSKFGGSFTGLDKAYVSAQAGSTTVTKVYIPGSAAHIHNYNGTEITTIEPTATTCGRKSISCSTSGCDAVKISVIPPVEQKLDAPMISAASVNGSTVALTWNSVDNATSYRIYRANSENGEKTLIKTVGITSCNDTTIKTNGTYYYFVQAYSSSLQLSSDYSAAKAVTVSVLSAPTISNVSASGTTVSLSWNSVANATSYRVYRSETANGAKQLIKTVGITSCADTTVQSGKTYYYFVQAYNSKTTQLSVYSAAKSVTISSIGTPAISSITSSGNTVNLKWNTIDGATSYRIYRANTANGTKSLIKTVGITSCNDTTAVAGNTYYYFVQAYSSKTGLLSGYSAAKGITLNFNAPTISAISYNGANVNISWTKVDSATSYRVYRADSQNGTKTLIKTVGITSCNDTTAVAGKTYYYFIQAYNSATAQLSGYSAAKAVTTNVLSAPVISSATVNGSTITLTWNTINSATSYRIYRTTSNNSTKTLVKTVGITSCNDYNVTAGTTYYYYVQAYNSATQQLSAYSNSYKVTV